MQFKPEKSNYGYTLFEALTIVVILGIFSAIAAPSWLAFLNRQRLNVAQAEALSIMREAQANAKKEKRVWEACFRQNEAEKKVEWSVHPMTDSGGAICGNARWQNLIGSDANKIEIDSSRSTPRSSSKVYPVRFNHKGRSHGSLGRVTFMTPNSNNNRVRRCVWISTLLGALRTDRDRGCDGD